MTCRACGVEAPTRYVVFYQNIGMLIVRTHRSVEGHLCKACIHRFFWELTTITLFLGWWGLISFFVTPFFLLNNLRYYVSSLGMKRRSTGWHMPQLVVTPHRGGTVLALGILSLLCAAGGFLGPVAVVLGTIDLRAMARGTMDRAGASLTRVGQVCGLLGTLMWGGLFILGLVSNSSAAQRHAVDRPEQGRMVQSTDGRSQVRLPAGWSVKSGLNGQADLQVGNTDQNAYLIVLTEPKIDFPDKMTYRDHARLTLGRMVKALDGATVARGPTELVVGGRPAIQYEVHGTADHLRVIYLHTTVDGNESFHQMLAWTVPSRLESNRKALNDMINSFSERE
jgi:hypothetical protein